MEQQKKRHNPEITREDLVQAGIDPAVKAFDKNKDALPVKDGLEQKVQLEKGDGALEQEFCHLVNSVYGENLYLNGSPLKEANNKYPGVYWHINRLIRKAGWFRNAEIAKYISITLFREPDRVDDGVVVTERSLPIYEKGKFNPIKITAYTPDALKKTREFAKQYKSFTGQEITLIQECADEEEMNAQLGKKAASNIEEAVKEYDKEAVKDKLSEMKWNLFTGAWDACLATFFFGTTVKGIYDKDPHITLASGVGCLFFAYFSRKAFKEGLKLYEDSLKKNYKKEN